MFTNLLYLRKEIVQNNFQIEAVIEKIQRFLI